MDFIIHKDEWELVADLSMKFLGFCAETTLQCKC